MVRTSPPRDHRPQKGRRQARRMHGHQPAHHQIGIEVEGAVAIMFDGHLGQAGHSRVLQRNPHQPQHDRRRDHGPRSQQPHRTQDHAGDRQPLQEPQVHEAKRQFGRSQAKGPVRVIGPQEQQIDHRPDGIEHQQMPHPIRQPRPPQHRCQEIPRNQREDRHRDAQHAVARGQRDQARIAPSPERLSGQARMRDDHEGGQHHPQIVHRHQPRLRLVHRCPQAPPTPCAQALSAHRAGGTGKSIHLRACVARRGISDFTSGPVCAKGTAWRHAPLEGGVFNHG